MAKSQGVSQDDNTSSPGHQDKTAARTPKDLYNHVILPIVGAVLAAAAGSVVTFLLTRPAPSAETPKVLICSVLYDPPGYDEPNDESIKLCNCTRDTVDISGWKLKDSNGEFEIPRGTVLLRGEQWEVQGSTYNPDGRAEGLWLHNSHEFVKLLDRQGELVDTYEW